jgi:hypothetical protein
MCGGASSGERQVRTDVFAWRRLEMGEGGGETLNREGFWSRSSAISRWRSRLPHVQHCALGRGGLPAVRRILLCVSQTGQR